MVYQYLSFQLAARSLQASLCELRPDKLFTRHTQTRLRQGYAAAGRTRTFCLRDQASRRASTRQACGGKKNVNRFAIIITFMPERHLKLLPGQGRPGKKSLLSAYVCVCLRLNIHLFFMNSNDFDVLNNKTGLSYH